MWEPFSEPARHAIVRAQEVAQMFGSTHIGTEHLTFALAETDDAVGEALAHAIDRAAIRELLGSVGSAPTVEMVFTSGAKRSIELAFENARRLNHNFIGKAHIALGILAADDPPPLLPHADPSALRKALDLAALNDAARSRDPAGRESWTQIEGDAHPAMRGVAAGLSYFPELRTPGTRVTLTIASPDSPERRWTWINDPDPKR